MEEWRPVRGFPFYAVSDEGRVFSFRRNRCMKPSVRPDGYLQVRLRRRKGYRKVGRTVHRLVTRAFRGPRPAHLQVAHLDGVRSNNRLSNLIYATVSENHRHKQLHGTAVRGSAVKMAVLSEKEVLEIRRLHVEGYTQRSLAARFGTHFGNISAIINRKSWKWL